MKQLEEHLAEPEEKKLRVQPSDPKEATIEEERTLQYRQQVYNKLLGK
jgi:hypothetical protein